MKTPEEIAHEFYWVGADGKKTYSEADLANILRGYGIALLEEIDRRALDDVKCASSAIAEMLAELKAGLK